MHLPHVSLEGGRITPEQWYWQWAMIPHLFDANTWDFEVMVGKEGVEVFQHSFDLGRFNSAGSHPWLKRNKTNATGHTVGSLIEYQSLKDSITYRVRRESHPDKIHFWADPKFHLLKGERKEGEAIRSVLYAATHNEGIGNMPQRQFMPTKGSDSTVLEDKMEALEMYIFQGIPARKIK